MKCLNFLIGLLLIANGLAAQNLPYQVVFDLTSKDTTDHKAVIRMLKGITSTNPDANLEVVFYGQSLDMITKDKSIVADDIKDLLQKNNVSFKACEASMKRHKVDKSQLLTGIQTVPDGIYEIYNKQKEGWGYIKVAH